MKIYCPKCNSEYDVDSELTGKMADCGSCGEKFLIQETIFLSSNNKKETKKLPFYRKIIVIFGALFLIMAIIHSMKWDKKSMTISYSFGRIQRKNLWILLFSLIISLTTIWWTAAVPDSGPARPRV